MGLNVKVAITIFAVLLMVLLFTFLYIDRNILHAPNIEPIKGSISTGCEQTDEKCYDKNVLAVWKNTPITFSNTDYGPHTLTSGTLEGGPTGVFDSGLLESGDTYTFTIEEPGTYEHYCLVHPWMKGKIVVW